MKEVEVGGHNYRIGKLDAMRQFHCMRRLAPIVAQLGVASANLSKNMAALPEDTLGQVLAAGADVLARMSNQDTEYIIHTCMSVVQRQDGEKWQRVMTSDGAFIYADANDMTVMMRLTMEALQENIAGFFGGLPELGSPG